MINGGSWGNLGPTRPSSHVSSQACRIWLSHGQDEPHQACSQAGSPHHGCHSCFLAPSLQKQDIFFSYSLHILLSGCINIVLLGSPQASFHPGSQAILSRQIHRSVLTAGVVHGASSPFWPQVFPPGIPLASALYSHLPWLLRVPHFADCAYKMTDLILALCKSTQDC